METPWLGRVGGPVEASPACREPGGTRCSGLDRRRDSALARRRASYARCRCEGRQYRGGGPDRPDELKV